MDDQRILQSNWTRRTSDHIQPKMLISDATFPWCKKSIIWLHRRYFWLKNPATWLKKKYQWPHPTKCSSLSGYLSLMTVKKLRYAIIFRDIDDQRILTFDWTRDTTSNTKQKWGSHKCYLPPLMTNSMQKTKILFDYFQRYWWSFNHPAIWLDQKHIWQQPTRHSLKSYLLLTNSFHRR